MFTLKFFKTRAYNKQESQVINIGDDAISTVFQSSSNFDVYEKPDGSVEICVNGVSYTISMEEDYFDACYVENMSGKTINVYRGSREPQEPV